MSLVHRILKKFFPPVSLPCVHEKKSADAWLTKNIPEGTWTPPACRDATQIEERRRMTDAKGKQPLWEGYKALKQYQRTDTERSATEVSTFGPLGRAFTDLVRKRRPSLIVEIGTAFGLSGMHWLSGIKETGVGHLLTFEPNALWAGQAEENLRSVDTRFTLVRGTFEDHVAQQLKPGNHMDIALIDAIHTSAFVLPEFEMVLKHAVPGALILIDDIDFSDDMRDCWKTLWNDPRVLAAVSFGRLGVLEMR